MRRFAAIFVAASVLVCRTSFSAGAESTAPPDGLRSNTPQVHAITGARLVVAPGKVIEKGTLVVRDGVIAAVGADVEAPADARRWDAAGKTVYAGLIDAYGELPESAATSAPSTAAYWNANIVPQFRADSVYRADAETNKKLRSQGVVVRLVAPASGIIKGTSALVTTGDDEPSRAITQAPVALHAKLTTRMSRERSGYPTSPMGALALVRQALYDAQWYRKAWEVYRARDRVARPERNEALEVLQSYVGDGLPMMIDAPDEQYFLRANQVASEFGVNLIVRGSGHEYRRLEAIHATGRAVIVPVDFPKAPDVRTAEAAATASLESLLHWDLAPENPGRLEKARVRFAFTSHGLKDKGTLLAQVRKAVHRALSVEGALAALTTTPAEMLGVSQRLGTLEVGYAANFVVTDGDLFAERTKVLETWVDGRRYEVVAAPVADVRGTWNVQLASVEGERQESIALVIKLEGEPAKLSGKVSKAEKETKLSSATLDDARLACAFKAGPLEWTDGVVQLSMTVAQGDEGSLTAIGEAITPDGRNWRLTATRTTVGTGDTPRADTQPPASDALAKPVAPESTADPMAPTGDAKKEEAKPEPPKTALFDVSFPLGAFGVTSTPEQPKALVFRGATVWTSGPAGLLEGASVLVESGKIAAVGTDLTVPEGAVVVECGGKHITPGLIDCHSHIATDGGVNESGQAITAEVRIGDFIDSTDVNIYRQIAGGLTTSNILHGSANPIGGQNQVIKLRWGQLPEEMKFAEAPPGIKFALGENVKQSNWGDRFTTRYPQTRMGVEQLVRDEFRAALDYRQARDHWQTYQAGLPPRVDLELEAVAEILEAKRLIHCHSYRQDEILALMRTCEEFGVRIGTFQHILEGYKVADVMARHGVGASSFSDWWAYKFEVYDAIPYNGALLHEAGVVVSFNSDDAELARRMNLEAAKAVKYGGVPPAEALKFVTLNPARQLGIDGRVGSLEPRKDADVIVWSGSPLSSYSHCEQTWIDGRKYFDRQQDLSRRQEEARMRQSLVQRILTTEADMESPGDEKPPERTLWPRVDLFCAHGDEE